MSSEPNYTGKICVVEHIDDTGQIWFGYGCAIIPTEDKFEILKKEEKNEKLLLF